VLCYLDGTGEALAGVLRPGNAGSNTAADHTAVLELALEQLDAEALAGEILVRADGAGASHELTQFCRDGQLRFSFGFDVDERVRDALAGLPESAWEQAIPRRRHAPRALPRLRDHRPRRPLRLARGVAADRQAHQAQGRRPARVRRPRRLAHGRCS